MSLQVLAQQMAAQGRGPDSVLVHMAPQEVQGLQQLAQMHGGSLTTNPQTGLPEAGFLSSILPVIVGGAATVMSGGAITPLMAGALMGGGTALATGSLQKGLMAGLGAYGGGSLGGGLAGLGEAGAGAAASDIAGQAGAQAAESAKASSLLNGLSPEEAAKVAAQDSDTVSAAIGPRTSPEFAAAQPSGWDKVKAGASRITDPGGVQAYIDQLGGNKQALMTGLAALSPLLMQQQQGYRGPAAVAPMNFSYDPRRVANPQAGYTGAPTGERTYFNPTFTRMAAGGRLHGPGDGVSDSIPAMIDGQAPAALASDEYVVPARVVAEIGNGSSSAGARRLDEMVQRVQARAGTALRGRASVAKDTGAYKELPA